MGTIGATPIAVKSGMPRPVTVMPDCHVVFKSAQTMAAEAGCELPSLRELVVHLGNRPNLELARGSRFFLRDNSEIEPELLSRIRGEKKDSILCKVNRTDGTMKEMTNGQEVAALLGEEIILIYPGKDPLELVVSQNGIFYLHAHNTSFD